MKIGKIVKDSPVLWGYLITISEFLISAVSSVLLFFTVGEWWFALSVLVWCIVFKIGFKSINKCQGVYDQVYRDSMRKTLKLQVILDCLETSAGYELELDLEEMGYLIELIKLDGEEDYVLSEFRG